MFFVKVKLVLGTVFEQDRVGFINLSTHGMCRIGIIGVFIGMPLLHHRFVSGFDVGEGSFVAQAKERFGLDERVK